MAAVESIIQQLQLEQESLKLDAKAKFQRLLLDTHGKTTQLQTRGREKIQQEITRQRETAQKAKEAQAKAQGTYTPPVQEVAPPGLQKLPGAPTAPDVAGIVAQLTANPGSVQGGGAVQGGGGIGSGQGNGPPPIPGLGDIPQQLTSHQDQTGVQLIQGRYGIQPIQTTTSTTSTRPNALTPQNIIEAQQQQYFNQQRLNQEETRTRFTQAIQVGEAYGERGGPLAAKILRKEELTPDDFKSAGKSLNEKSILAQVEASKAATETARASTALRYKEMEHADKLFEWNKQESLFRMVGALRQNGQPVSQESVPLSSAMGLPETSTESTVLQQSLARGIQKWSTVGKGFFSGTMIEATDQVPDPLHFFLEVGQPAARLGLVAVLDPTAKRSEDVKHPIGTFTTIPLSTYLAERAIAEGRVPTASAARKLEAKGRLVKWGFGEEGQDFMRYYATKLDTDTTVYRGTRTEAEGLQSVGVITPNERIMRQEPGRRDALDEARRRQDEELRLGMQAYETLMNDPLLKSMLGEK